MYYLSNVIISSWITAYNYGLVLVQNHVAVIWSSRPLQGCMTYQICHITRLMYSIRIQVVPSPRGDSSKFFPLCSAQKQVLWVFSGGPNSVVEIQNKGHFSWIHQVIKVALKLWPEFVVLCVERAGVFPNMYFSGGILDRVKVCVVTAYSRAVNRWIGIGTVWLGPAYWAFFEEYRLWVSYSYFTLSNPPTDKSSALYQPQKIP